MSDHTDRKAAHAVQQLLDHGWQVVLVPSLFGGAPESLLSWIHDGVIDTLRFYLDGQRAALIRVPARWTPTVPPTHSPPLWHEDLPTAVALARALEITLDHHEHASASRSGEDTQRWSHPELASPDQHHWL